MSQPVELTPSDAIAIFTGISSLLLAVVAACVSLLATGRGFVFDMGENATPKRLAFATLGCIVTMSAGALVSWGQIYLGGSWRGVFEALVAFCLLVGICFPAAVAYLFYKGFSE